MEYPELSDDHDVPVPPTPPPRASAQPPQLPQPSPVTLDWQRFRTNLLTHIGVQAAIGAVAIVGIAIADDSNHLHTRRKTYWFYHLFASVY